VLISRGSWRECISSDWMSLGTQSAHNWLMLHLESGGAVCSNFGMKMGLSEQEPGTEAATMVTHFHRMTVSLTVPPPIFIFCSFLQNHLTLSDSLFQVYLTIINMILEFI
jgi:hypothetical protein